MPLSLFRARVIRSPRPSLHWALELLWTLAAHRVNLRYKETLFGIGWIFLQPVAMVVIFNYIRKIAAIPSSNIPYPLFTATGIIAWSLTALIVSQTVTSFTSYASILKRISLPKILLPGSIVIATFADLCIMAVLFGGLLIYYGVPLSFSMLSVIFPFAVHLALVIGLACLISLAHVFLRDIGHAIPSILQLWFFASPVFYPTSMVPEEFQTLSRWNPMSGLIEGYRSTLLLGQMPSWDTMGPALIVSVAILASGLFCLWRMEGNITDML